MGNWKWAVVGFYLCLQPVAPKKFKGKTDYMPTGPPPDPQMAKKFKDSSRGCPQHYTCCTCGGEGMSTSTDLERQSSRDLANFLRYRPPPREPVTTTLLDSVQSDLSQLERSLDMQMERENRYKSGYKEALIASSVKDKLFDAENKALEDLDDGDGEGFDSVSGSEKDWISESEGAWFGCLPNKCQWGPHKCEESKDCQLMWKIKVKRVQDKSNYYYVKLGDQHLDHAVRILEVEGKDDKRQMIMEGIQSLHAAEKAYWHYQASKDMPDKEDLLKERFDEINEQMAIFKVLEKKYKAEQGFVGSME